MKKSMMELVREAKEIDLSLEAMGGEIDESMEVVIYQNRLDLKTKADSCAFFHEHLEADIASWKKRKEEAAQGLAVAQRKLERYETYLKESLRGIGGEISGDYMLLKVKPTKGNLLTPNKELIPMQYKKEIITREWEIDNKAIKEDLALGIPVPGAELKINHSLTIKPHNGGK